MVHYIWFECMYSMLSGCRDIYFIKNIVYFLK